MLAPVLAARVGTEVPHEFAGTVCGVFRHAVALSIAQPDRSTLAGVRMVTLVAEAVPMTAVSVSAPLPDRLDPLAARDGDPVDCHGGVLRIASLAVDLNAGRRYAGKPIDVERVPRSRRCSRLVAAAVAAHEALGEREGGWLATRARREVAARIEALAAALAAADAPAVQRLAHSLVGLGPGLTPSGDDALCGLLLGRRSLGRATAADDIVREVAADAWGDTTDISAQQLALAAEDRFGEALLAVVAATAEGDGPAIEAATRACLAVGATSGADGVLGLLAAWNAGYLAA